MRNHYKRSADQMLDVVEEEMPSQSSDAKYLTDHSRTVQRIKKHTKAPTLPIDIVRDYIAYARKYCAPKLTAKAASILKDFYINMKHPTNGMSEPLPITTRQLESMVRLAQARAKASLRPYVTVEDAQDVVDIMTQSIFGTLIDVNGQLDTQRGGSTGKSKSKKKKSFLEMLLKRSEASFTNSELVNLGIQFLGDDTTEKTMKDMIYEMTSDTELLRDSSVLDEYCKPKLKVNQMWINITMPWQLFEQKA